jgi:U3 small nucleolar RNA-associated protein 10
LADDIVSVLHGLLISIPSFWGVGEFVQIVTVFLEPSHCAAMNHLMKTMAKKAPSSVLFQALINIWPAVTQAVSRF